MHCYLVGSELAREKEKEKAEKEKGSSSKNEERSQ